MIIKYSFQTVFYKRNNKYTVKLGYNYHGYNEPNF